MRASDGLWAAATSPVEPARSCVPQSTGRVAFSSILRFRGGGEVDIGHRVSIPSAVRDMEVIVQCSQSVNRRAVQIGWLRVRRRVGYIVSLTPTTIVPHIAQRLAIGCQSSSVVISADSTCANWRLSADPGHSERPDLDHFLYGGNMPDADREALIRNWEESNGRKAPPRMGNQLNLNGQWPQVVA